MRRIYGIWLAGALATAIGCGDSNPGTTPPTDTGKVPDAGDQDTGTPPVDTGTPEDTGTPPVDTGTPKDTGTPVDTGPTPCATGEMRCGDTCVDVQSNNANCGMCNNACAAGQTCRTGMCQMEMMCPMGRTQCGTNCVDTATDNMNCGSCGNACAAGQSCQGGACMADMPCPTGQTRCSGACVDTMTDANNCGMCGTACAAGESCTAGTCRAMMMCGTNERSCGGVCVNTSTDNNNCGGCGTVCTMGQTCQSGTCRAMTCTMGQTLCGSTCVNTMTDASNCGSCGRACAMGQTCAGGMCTGTSMCPMGQTSCTSGAMTVCADLMTDERNCGMCGRACTTTQTCTAGMCVTSRPMCPTGQTDCTPTAATPTCVNLQTNAMNCGRCGTVCPTGQTCVAGACACATGQSLCGRTCVNLMTDAANCGACGRACPTGRACVAGACACPTGQMLCGGTCVNTMTDNSNCGMCGRVCATGQTCTAGACTCGTGTTACTSGTTTVCANLMTDRANCGRCNNACAMGQTCTAGACACPTGQTLCGTGTAAACVDLMTNSANCGRCGMACATGTSCMAGTCRGMPPANDTRTGATVITLSAGNSQNLAANTTSARHDTNGNCNCTTAGNDVFYRFTLTAPTFVYADTLGTTWDTALFLQDAAGNNLTPGGTGQVTCNDDVTSAGFCAIAGNLQSQIAARLNPGTYYLVLSGCGAGMATIHFQHLPAGSGATTARITPNATLQNVMGATSGTGAVASTCCSGGPENSYFWITCPNATATTFYASSCNATTGANLANYDVEVAQYSALRPTAMLAVCNDDVGTAFTCGAGASMTSTIPATTATQGGLNTLLVDSCVGSGNYTVNYILSNCAAGTNRCGASCVNTQTDENHCGGCDRRCGTGQTCSGGTCQNLRAGETRDNPIAITSGAATVSVNTSLYRNDTMGTCGCSAGNDVFYSFTVPTSGPYLVYADTVGSSYDTSLFFQTDTGTNVTAANLTNGATCNDDGGLLGCSTGRQSQVLARLDPGRYLLVLSGCNPGGAASIRFHMLPVGSGALAQLNAGSRVISGTTMGTAGRVTSACCSSGPEDTWFWYTCPGYAGGVFTASTCGRATWDTELHEVSPGRTLQASLCNDDGCDVRRSQLTTSAASLTNIPAGPGLHALYVDGCNNNSGAYTASVTRP